MWECKDIECNKDSGEKQKSCLLHQFVTMESMKRPGASARASKSTSKEWTTRRREGEERRRRTHEEVVPQLVESGPSGRQRVELAHHFPVALALVEPPATRREGMRWTIRIEMFI